MPLLNDTEIRKLCAAVLSAGLTGSRSALLAGLDGAFVAGGYITGMDIAVDGGMCL